jgi:hypothetical protein
LTYRGVYDWQPRHLSDCLKVARRWCQKQRARFRYVWVAELQQRGAIHYHLAIWLPKFDKNGWWPHGMTQRVTAKNPVGYLMKYLSKIGPLQAFPKGARIHGYGGLTQDARGICSWLNLPSWCENGQPLSYYAMRSRFDKARELAKVSFQFRDIRAKAATDTGDLAHSQKLLAHKNREMTEHYVRARLGERVRPLR